MSNPEKSTPDMESGREPTKIPHIKMLFDQGATTPEVENHQYAGSGTEEDPYVVVWLQTDPRDPMQFSFWYKWQAVISMAFSILAVSLDSSAYSGGKAPITCQSEPF
jgi:hypothetical protein